MDKYAAASILKQLLLLDAPIEKLMVLAPQFAGQRVEAEIKSITSELLLRQGDAIREIVKIYPELESDETSQVEQNEIDAFLRKSGIPKNSP